jgi:hypothetical protein
MTRNLLVLLTFTLAISSIHAIQNPSEIVYPTNAQINTATTCWVNAMGNLNDAQRFLQINENQIYTI